jgi:hypothetical protein
VAYTSIMFENPNTGAIKEAPVGFSWTTLFFSFFPALFRGDWKWAVIILILSLITYGLSGLLFMFIYNKLYIKDLIGSGFKARSIASGDMDFAAGKLGIQIPRLESA